MTRIFGTFAAVALTAAFAMPTPVVAAEKRDGVRNQDQIEVSDQRRYRRAYYRGYGPRYGYARYGYARPYYAAPYYAYAPRPYYRPYYGPSVGIGVGPFGFGVW